MKNGLFGHQNVPNGIGYRKAKKTDVFCRKISGQNRTETEGGGWCFTALGAIARAKGAFSPPNEAI
jgi:hypothetical protein